MDNTLSELERAVGAVPDDVFSAYMAACREAGEPTTPEGLLDFAGAANPVAGVERAFIVALERRYPGTRWSRRRDVGNQGGGVRRSLVAEDDANALGYGLAPALGLVDDDGRE
jgi:hypothetical protein